jgi:hypothetical protein
MFHHPMGQLLLATKQHLICRKVHRLLELLASRHCHRLLQHHRRRQRPNLVTWCLE